MSLLVESVEVKLEPEWERDAETKPIKLEVELLPCVTSTYTPYTKVESPDTSVKMEVDVKKEVDCELGEDSYVKPDAVYGPELLKLLTNPVDLASLAQVKHDIQPLRSCSVQVERMPERKKKPYSCKICYKIFDLKTSLLTHLDVHSAEELHPPISVKKRVNKVKTTVECDICGQMCASNSHLVIHYRKHTGERPYACKLCDKSYPQRANLLKHELCHTGEKPYNCPSCMKRFSLKISLLKHVCVPYKKTYPCEICKLQCNSKMELIKHIEVHTERVSCNICSIKFKDKADLEHHMLIHTCLAQMRRNFKGRDFTKYNANGEKHHPTKRKPRGGKSGKKAW